MRWEEELRVEVEAAGLPLRGEDEERIRRRHPREDEERIRRRHPPKILLRNQGQDFREPLQSAHELLGRSRQEHCTSVGHIFAVARDRHDRAVATA